MKTLGKQIKQSRIDQGLTQSQLAQQAGVSRDWIIRFEAGESPGLELGKAMGVFGVLGFSVAPLEALATDEERAIVKRTALTMAYEKQDITPSDELRILRDLVGRRLVTSSGE